MSSSFSGDERRSFGVGGYVTAECGRPGPQRDSGGGTTAAAGLHVSELRRFGNYGLYNTSGFPAIADFDQNVRGWILTRWAGHQELSRERKKG